MDAKARKIWQHPWGYREGFLLITGLIFVGFLLEFLSKGKGFPAISWPVNSMALGIFVIVIVVIALFARKKPVIRWLASMPAAMSGIAAMSLFVLLMGLIVQKDDSGLLSRLGLRHISTSWPFVLSSFFLILVLSFTIIKRIVPFTFKNLVFALNHLGLWLILVSVALGAGDMKRLKMDCTQGTIVWYGRDDAGNITELPFAFDLQEFIMTEYEPELVILNAENEPDKIIQISTEAGRKYEYAGYEFQVKDFYTEAANLGDTVVKLHDAGSVPAIYVLVIKSGKQIAEGWICSGSYLSSPEFLDLEGDSKLGLNRGKPKEFSSRLKLYQPDKTISEVRIAVNEPLSVGGWNVYQYGYDDAAGKYSRLSVLEAVKDPWIYVIYSGIGLMLGGALLMFWSGRKKNG